MNVKVMMASNASKTGQKYSQRIISGDENIRKHLNDIVK
jgi:hypothetical protein